jgi:hypothetical protein
MKSDSIGRSIKAWEREWVTQHSIGTWFKNMWTVVSLNILGKDLINLETPKWKVIQLADIPHQGLRERMTDPTQHRDLILEYVDRAVAEHPW